MMRIGMAILAGAVGTLMTITPSVAGAQCTVAGDGDSCNRNGSVSMTAGRVILLQMSAASTPLTAPTPTDFDAGFNSTAGPTITIRSNSSWRLNLRSSTALWSATTTSPGAPARANKPAADLRWSTASGGPFVALTTTNVNFFSGNATAGSSTTLYFQTLYAWTLDTPGDYSLALVLTLTSP